jgi:hypothetical protein
VDSGGTPIQGGGVVQQGTGGVKSGGTVQQYPTTIQRATGGVKSGGTVQQYPGTIQKATGGVKSGGTVQQYPPTIQRATGGVKSGGTAPASGVKPRPTMRSKNSGINSNGTMNVGVGGPSQNGDLLVFVFQIWDGSGVLRPITVPLDWNTALSTGQTNEQQMVAWKVSTGEPAGYTFNAPSLLYQVQWVGMVWAGTDGTLNVPSWDEAQSTAYSAPSVNARGVNDVLALIVGSNGNPTFGPSTPATTDVQNATGTNGAVHFRTANLTAGGATGNYTGTLSAPVRWSAALLDISAGA